MIVLAGNSAPAVKAIQSMTSFNSKTLTKIHHDLPDHLPFDPALRPKALESLLTEKKLLNPAAIDAWIEMCRDEIGPKRGAARPRFY